MKIIPPENWPATPYGRLRPITEHGLTIIEAIDLTDLDDGHVTPLTKELLPPKAQCLVDRCDIHLFLSQDAADAFTIGLTSGLAAGGYLIQLDDIRGKQHTLEAANYAIVAMSACSLGHPRHTAAPLTRARVQILGASTPMDPAVGHKTNHEGLLTPYSFTSKELTPLSDIVVVIASYYNCPWPDHQRRITMSDHRASHIVSLYVEDFTAAADALHEAANAPSTGTHAINSLQAAETFRTLQARLPREAQE